MSDSAYILATFFGDERYSIPDSQFSIPVSATRVELNDLIKQTSNFSLSSSLSQNLEYDFLIHDKLIRGTLEDHISQHQLSTEEVLPIQCIQRNPPPAVSDCIDHKDWVSAVHCHRELILTGCYDNNVRVWTNKGELVCIAEGHNAPIKDVRWISENDGEFLFVSASQDQNVHIWRLILDSMTNHATKGHVTLVHRCKGHAGSVEAIDVNSDRSKFCSVSWDSYIKIWSSIPDPIPVDEVEQESDLPTKRQKIESDERASIRTPLMTLQGHTNAVTTVVWAGTIEGVERVSELGEDVISGGWDHCIRVWDMMTGANKTTLNGSKVFHSIDWSRNNSLIASGSSDKTVRLWDPRQTESSMILTSLSSHTGWVVSVKWSPSNPHHLLSGSYDSTLRLWDTRSNKKPLFSIMAHEGKVLCSDWSDKKMFASGGTDNKLRTYSI